MRGQLPRARLEVHGAAGHLERAAAEAREGARIAGRCALAFTKVVAAVAGFGVFCAVIVGLSGSTMRSRQLQRDLERMRQLQQSLRWHDQQIRALQDDGHIRAVLVQRGWDVPAGVRAIPVVIAVEPIRVDAPRPTVRTAPAKPKHRSPATP